MYSAACYILYLNKMHLVKRGEANFIVILHYISLLLLLLLLLKVKSF